MGVGLVRSNCRSAPGVFSYPILLRNFDTTDETMMSAFMLQSVSFAEASYDYLVMLTADGEGKILPYALKFPKRFFQCLHAELNGETFKYVEDFTSPFPVEVTPDMLECFDGGLMLKEQSPDRKWLGQIGDIGEELWVYSKTRELLTDDADRQYLSDSLADVRSRIEGMLDSLGDSDEADTVGLIKGICSEVFSGGKFGDREYNDLIVCIQAKA